MPQNLKGTIPIIIGTQRIKYQQIELYEPSFFCPELFGIVAIKSLFGVGLALNFKLFTAG
jgi:hypothetical protein